MWRQRTPTALLAIALLAGCGQEGSEQLLINGAGATFPFPIYSKWTDEYTKVDPTVHINYQSNGSGAGEQSILERTVDFGASDGPMSDTNLARAPGKILHNRAGLIAGIVVYHQNFPFDCRGKHRTCNAI